jgi:paraquat-inducible protein B
VHADLPREGDALVLPSQGGGLDGLIASLSDIATKVDKIPFEQIGQNANGALRSVQHLATNVDTNAGPALAQLPAIVDQMSQAAKSANGTLGANGYGANSEFQHNMERLMSEATDAARSFRVLADYLDRHPEALIRGRASQTGER